MVAEKGQGKWEPGSQMNTSGSLSQGAQISPSLRDQDVKWVSFDEATLGETQTGDIALEGVPPALAATNSTGTRL